MITCGIDNGTQSTKVMIYDSTLKKVLSLTSSKHQIISKEDGTREQKAEWWTDALIDAFSQVSPEIKGKIEAVGVSGQQHGFVPVAEDGSVLAPVKLWCDTSTAGECEELNSALGGVDCAIEKTGNEIKPGYTASKVLWFKKNHPDLYDRMRWIMLPHDYLNFVLTEKPSMEYGDASGTAFFDVRKRVWSDEVLLAIDNKRDLKASLPPLYEEGTCVGYVSHKASLLFGIPEGIPVSTGGGDNMMGAIGTGTVSEGDLTMSMGTSGTLYGASSTPIIDRKNRLAAFCSSTGTWLPLLCTMNCTVSSETTRALFNRDIIEFNEIARKAPIGAEGCYMLPYFNGERTPNYPNGRGCLFGFNLTNMTEENISRAAMEAAVFALKYGLDAFRELGFKPGTIKLIGGGSKSPFWRQMVADVMGLPVKLPIVEESASFGAALQALYLLEKERGNVKSIDEITSVHVKMQEEKTCIPDKESERKYREVYSAWLKYVDIMAPLFS